MGENKEVKKDRIVIVGDWGPTETVIAGTTSEFVNKLKVTPEQIKITLVTASTILQN